MVAQCRDGLNRGYSVFYMKIGVDERREEAMVAAIRQTIGAEGKIRLDVNQSWSLPQAARVLGKWHERYDLDFVEAPVPVDPVENMLDLKRRVAVPLCVNEGLWREADAMRVINSRCADYLCISQYWVGSLRRLHTVIHAAHLSGQLICKHTHGEYGIAAACGQHMMLAAPNACDGHQQTAQVMKDDILKARIPIADGPKWGLLTGPGLGVEVDEEKVKRYHEAYLREGEYVTFGDGFRPRR
jgi:glucarate dehydratase